MPFWAMPREGGLTGTVIAVEGRVRLWGLLVLLLRRFRAGFHTRIISDKNVIAQSAAGPSHMVIWLDLPLFYKYDFFWAEASGVSLAGWALARSTQFGSVFLTARTCRTAMARAMCAPCADRTRANGEVGIAPNHHVRTATKRHSNTQPNKSPN